MHYYRKPLPNYNKLEASKAEQRIQESEQDTENKISKYLLYIGIGFVLLKMSYEILYGMRHGFGRGLMSTVGLTVFGTIILYKILRTILPRPLAIFLNTDKRMMEFDELNDMPDLARQELESTDKSNESEALVYIGRTTGYLRLKSHKFSMLENQNYFLGLGDALKNFVCFGDIANDKTYRFMLPMANRLIRNLQGMQLGGLVLNVSVDFASKIVQEAGSRVTDIEYAGRNGNEMRGFNLLEGISPDTAGDLLEPLFKRYGKPGYDGVVNSAVKLCKNALVLLKYSGSYDLHSLYRFVCDEDFRQKQANEALSRINFAYGTERESVNEAIRCINSYSGAYDLHHVKEVVENTLKGDLIKEFSCSGNHFDMRCLLDGKILIVSLPVDMRHQASANIICTFIKQNFFSMVQERLSDSSLGRKYVFFVCEDYQEFVTEKGFDDRSFWNSSQESGCIGLISVRSVDDFDYNSSKGSYMRAVLQNFRQRFCFKSENAETYNYIKDVVGEESVTNVSHVSLETDGTASGTMSGKAKSSGDWFAHTDISADVSAGLSAQTKGTIVSQDFRNLITRDLMDSLAPGTALMLSQCEGENFNDVIRL